MACPFLDEADTRCAGHFNLNHLAEAFTQCLGRYQACPVYQRLMRDRAVSMSLATAGAATAGAARIAG
ncbi:MAG: hypothetical protein PHU85_16560 [Phycisphaerae bacterium]|nr:hypothetical protein [Phycisphaerae bacterium]